MVSVAASYVITLYLLVQIEGKQQKRQQYDRIDEVAAPNEGIPKNGLETGQMAKPVKSIQQADEGN